MKKLYWCVIGFLCLVCLPLAACSQVSPAKAEPPKPIKIVHLSSASEPTREILTAEAAKRLDVQTAAVSEMMIDGKLRSVIPYAAVLYDIQGNAWVYTNPEPLTFIRHKITVDHIQGGQAVLSDSLPPGTNVVVVGAEELYGSEFEFKEE